MKIKLVAVFFALFFTTSFSTASAVVFTTGNFVSSPDQFNGFEGIGTAIYTSNSYSEGGITVSYNGTLNSGDIYTLTGGGVYGQGTYRWYEEVTAILTCG